MVKVEELKKRFPVGVGLGVKDWLGTGNFALNWAISRRFDGGYPVGRVVEIFGDPSTGKSLLVLEALKNAQKRGYVVLLDDAEGSFDSGFAERIGLDLNNLFVVNSATVEEHFETVQDFVDEVRKKDKEVGIVVALDSLAILSTKHERDTGFEKPDLTKAKMVRQGMRVLGARFSRDNVLYLVCNHVIADIGKWGGGGKTTPGGTGISFQSSVRIELSVGSKIMGKGNMVDGVRVRARVVKNKVAPPFGEANFDIYFEKGLVKESGLLEKLVLLGIVEDKGAGWYEYGGKSYRRSELERKVVDLLPNLMRQEDEHN